MNNGFQEKLTLYTRKDEPEPIISTEFLDKVRLSGILESIFLHDKCGVYPSRAHLSFLVYKQFRNVSLVVALKNVLADTVLLQSLGYDVDNPPTLNAIVYFRDDVLSKDLWKELVIELEAFRHDNNLLITDSNRYQPIKNDQKFSFTAREKRLLVRTCLEYIDENIDVELKKNSTYSKKQLFDAISEFLSEQGTANYLSETYRDDPIIYYKHRQKVPTGRTILNLLRKLFGDREDVEKFFDGLLKRALELLKIKVPDVFNHSMIDIAFDTNPIPAFDNTKLYQQKLHNPDSLHRDIYTDPSDLISDAHIKDKGTINFRKYLCCSIVIKGQRFCISITPLTMLNNSSQEVTIDKMLNRVKELFPTCTIRRLYMDRGFDSENMYALLKKRGIRFVIAKIRYEGELKNKINAIDTDIDAFQYKVKKREEITVIVAKKKPKNMSIDDDNVITDSRGRKKYAFATNIEVKTKAEMQELVNGYGSRWSIETMFADKNEMYGKTTSNNNIIRDFYFDYTMMLLNIWVLSNIIFCYCYLKIEPSDPKIRLKSFKRYIRTQEIEDPPPENNINSTQI
jgi:hypothetical protein